MAEKEYIEREALHVAIEKAQIELESNDDKIWSRNKKYYKGLAWARAIITEQPAADVEEVVRCKDCKHSYFIKSCSKYECRKGCGTLKYSNDFCSYGERKEQK